MRRATLLAALLAPALLVGACATGTDPGAGDGGDAGTISPDPDSPVGSDDDTGAPTSPGDPGAPTAPVAADLTVSLDSTGSGTSETWTLTCEPAGGDHPDPDAACAALAAAGGAPAFDPVPRDTACTEIWGGPQVATVEGTVDGVRVSADFSRTNGCEISRWDALADLLGSPGGA